jgi:hypothetical protein
MESSLSIEARASPAPTEREDSYKSLGNKAASLFAELGIIGPILNFLVCETYTKLRLE